MSYLLFEDHTLSVILSLRKKSRSVPTGRKKRRNKQKTISIHHRQCRKQKMPVSSVTPAKRFFTRKQKLPINWFKKKNSNKRRRDKRKYSQKSFVFCTKTPFFCHKKKEKESNPLGPLVRWD